jgi:hypothetical protein
MAESSVYALCVHGIGHRTPASFADKAMKRLSAALSERGVTLYARSVHWGPLMDGPQEALLAKLQKYGSRGKLAQRIAVETLADALSYRHYQTSINHLFLTRRRALYRLPPHPPGRPGEDGQLRHEPESLPRRGRRVGTTAATLGPWKLD